MPFVLNLTGTGTEIVEVAAADSLKVIIAFADYVSGSSYDFEIVDPGAAAVEVAMLLDNLLAEEVTVTAVSAGADGITLTLPAVPFVIAAESSAAGTLVFDPAGTVVAAAQFDLTVETMTGGFTFSASGEGNYPPVARVMVQVSGAGTIAVNGTYYRTEEMGLGYPVYRLSSEYVLYGWDSDGGIEWAIDSDLDNATVFYSNRTTAVDTAPNGTPADWDWSGGTMPYPSTIGEIICPPGSEEQLQSGDVISPNYLYSDPEDTEGATLFQWYWSDSPTGTYLLMEGETNPSHTVFPTPFVDIYLKVRVTPVATDGITTGEPVWFGPSPVVPLVELPA